MLCYKLEADTERARALRTATNKPNASTPPENCRGFFIIYAIHSAVRVPGLYPAAILGIERFDSSMAYHTRQRARKREKLSIAGM